MAKTRFKQPNIITIEYRQEQGDPDYGSCLWANFNFDLERYDLTIMSDCGNYAYSWVATPNSESFMHLMSRVDQGYLLDKIAARCQVNYDETLANVKALISVMELTQIIQRIWKTILNWIWNVYKTPVIAQVKVNHMRRYLGLSKIPLWKFAMGTM